GLAGTGAHAGEREGGTPQLQKAASPHRIKPFGSVLGKLSVKEFLELGGLCERLETAPVLATSCGFEFRAQSLDVVLLVHVRVTHRWHVEQLVGGLTAYSLTSCGPSTAWSTAGRYPIVVISLRGRRLGAGFL